MRIIVSLGTGREFARVSWWCPMAEKFQDVRVNSKLTPRVFNVATGSRVRGEHSSHPEAEVSVLSSF